MKASSSTGGVKTILLQHAEKMVLGVAVILVALFLWSATRVKPIDASKSPDQLKTQAQSEIARITSSTYPPQPGSRIDFDSAVQAGLQPVEVTPFSVSTVLAPPTHPAIVKRPEPKYYPVEDLRATGTVISVPEEGVPPVWAEPVKEKGKAKAKKIEPKAPNLDGDTLRRVPTSRRRSREGGYGGTGPVGPQAVGRPGPKTDQAARGGANADTDRAGYGSTAKSGYGAAGKGESREGGYGATGYGAVGYGAGGAFGGRPGVQVSGMQAQGVVHPAVVLTGRVPYSKQFEEFQKKFKDAAMPEGHTPEMEIPTYMQFKIERQEVTAAGDAPWKALDVDAAIKSEGRWTIQPAETVDPAYSSDPVLTWPMPPTIGRDWNRLASHPSIPFQWMASDAAQLPLNTRGQQDIEAIKGARIRTNAPAEGAFSPYGGVPYRRGDSMTGANGVDAPVAQVSSLLFRYVDTDKVEPGKQYRYRVTLELANPNYGVSPALLEDIASSRQESRLTPPSDSPVVNVPRDRMLFALSSKAQSRPLAEYQGHLLFHVWDKKMGAEVAKEFDLNLGGIADFVTTVENWYNPYTGMGENLDNYHFQFVEGQPMLADINGGAPVPGVKSVEQPTEMLFIDSKGRMFTNNQARDSATAEFYKERYTLPTTPAGSESTILAPEQPRSRAGMGSSAPR